ncbi:hypothetical protein [Streptomyces sp. NPDC059142]|uniref:hypothetical protein n=1 Tax=Streptomyces sp. NPDC059142 TaxID=3346739 RepID=UPI0036AE30A3
MPQPDKQTDAVPAATLYEWQRRAEHHLAALIEHGASNNLPPLLWSLAPNGNLIGRADGLGFTPDVQRESVRRWADHVGAQVDVEHTSDGREELYAGWKDDERRTRGCFRATIFVHHEAPHPEKEGSAAYLDALNKLTKDPVEGESARKLWNSHLGIAEGGE